MKVFVEPTDPPKDKRSNIRYLAWFLAAILLVMALGQLFAFERFVPLVESFWLPGGRPVAYLTASLIVVSEVFALPYLLGMRLSSAMRYLSAICAVVVPSIWLLVVVWLNLTVNAVTNIGLFGTKFALPVGWWAVFFVLAIMVLVAWVLRGRPLALGRSN